MEHYRSLQILDELANNDSLTQRDLSSRLGIALGLVNSYIKNLITKGYVTVKTIPPKRYAYYLTPKGFTEKTRLAYHLFQDYTRIYREAKKNIRSIYKEMMDRGIKKVVLAGADEVAEIAFITLQETTLELVGVVDAEKSGSIYFGKVIQPLNSVHDMNYDVVIVSSYLGKEKMYHALLDLGVTKKQIRMIF